MLPVRYKHATEHATYLDSIVVRVENNVLLSILQVGNFCLKLPFVITLCPGGMACSATLAITTAACALLMPSCCSAPYMQ